jgi:predicted nuclease of predicted toxin-antitoxin system
MTLNGYKLLTDENIDPTIVAFLRQRGFDVTDVKENGWFGMKDINLMPLAYQEQRVIVTHDSDFGTIIFTKGEPFVGVLYLRPGHFDASPHIQSLDALLTGNLYIQAPFIVIAENTGAAVKIRLRQM